MLPAIWPGALVEFCGASHLRVGEIVLARTSDDSDALWLVHRVVAVDGDKVLLQGDGHATPDGWFPRSDVLGKAKGIVIGRWQWTSCPAPLKYVLQRLWLLLIPASRRVLKARRQIAEWRHPRMARWITEYLESSVWPMMRFWAKPIEVREATLRDTEALKSYLLRTHQHLNHTALSVWRQAIARGHVALAFEANGKDAQHKPIIGAVALSDDGSTVVHAHLHRHYLSTSNANQLLSALNVRSRTCAPGSLGTHWVWQVAFSSR